MHFKWRLEPEGHLVELWMSGASEKVTVDGVEVSSKTSFRTKSEHVFQLGNRPVSVRLKQSGLSYKAVLERDGLTLDPEPGGDRMPALGVITGILGAIGGVAASRAFGLLLLIPGGVALLSFAIAIRVVPEDGKGRFYVPAASLIWGHMAWIAVGLAMTGGEPVVWVEVLGVALAAAILLWKPTAAFALTLLAAEIAMAAMNVRMLDEVGSKLRMAMVLHVVLRALAIVALGWGVWRSAKAAREEAASSSSFEHSPAGQPEPLSPFHASLAAAPPPEIGSWLQCAACQLSHRVRPERTCPKCGAPDGVTPSAARAKPTSRSTPTPKAPRFTVPSYVGMFVVIGVVVTAVVLPIGKRRKGAASDRPSTPAKSVAGTAKVRGQIEVAGFEPGSRARVTFGGKYVAVDREGRFEIEGVRAGTHELAVRVDNTQEKELRAEVAVADGAEVIVPPFAFTPVTTVRGRVVFEALPDGVESSATATVHAVGADVRTEADHTGRFHLRVPAGQQVVRASAPGFEPVEATVSAAWGEREVKLPTMRRVVNQHGCAPRAEWVGIVSRDLVGVRSAAPDRKKDHLVRLMPCRSGTVQRIRLNASHGTGAAWDSSPRRDELLGVVRRSSPDKLLNGSGFELEVSAHEQLMLYLPRALEATTPHEVWLHYSDGSFDRAELPAAQR